jgi:hypothetical protein
MRWQCRWRGCEKWAQSNRHVLCSAHFRENAILLEHNYSGAEALANLRNDSIAAPAENDPPVDGPPFFPVDKNRRRCLQPRPLLVVAREQVGRGGVPVDEGPPLSPRRDRIQPNLPRPLLVAREEVGGVRELVSGDRVNNILAENANNNEQLLDVLADMAGAVGENIDHQANNNDTHGVVDAPVGDVPPADDIDDHHTMANVDAPQEPGVQVPPHIPDANNVADMAAVGENIDYQANNNDTHGVVDAPVGDVPPDDIDDHHTMANVDATPQEPGVQVPPDIPVDGHQHLLPRRLPTRPALTRTQQRDDYVLLREIESERRAEQRAQQQRDDYVRLQEIESERRAEQRAQQRAHDVADAHVCNITDQQLLNVDNQHHDVVANGPQELVHESGAVREQLGVHESESEQQFDFPGNEEEHDEYEWSSDIAQINHRLELLIQQQQLKDDKINELERRIKELEHWKNWPSCTSVGGDNFFGADSLSQFIFAGGDNEDNSSFNGGDDNRRRKRTRRRGRNPPLLESTAQPPTKRRTAIAPNNDQGQSPYYRDDFVNNPRRTNAPDPEILEDAHSGLTNCDVICYSNVIFQGLASCLHVSEFLRNPPNEEHSMRFPLYYAFASVMSSMVSGRERVVNPARFVNLFRDSHENFELQQGMYFDSQWMNKLTIIVPLTNSSSR